MWMDCVMRQPPPRAFVPRIRPSRSRRGSGSTFHASARKIRPRAPDWTASWRAPANGAKAHPGNHAELVRWAAQSRIISSARLQVDVERLLDQNVLRQPGGPRHLGVGPRRCEHAHHVDLGSRRAPLKSCMRAVPPTRARTPEPPGNPRADGGEAGRRDVSQTPSRESLRPCRAPIRCLRTLLVKISVEHMSEIDSGWWAPAWPELSAKELRHVRGGRPPRLLAGSGRLQGRARVGAPAAYTHFSELCRDPEGHWCACSHRRGPTSRWRGPPRRGKHVLVRSRSTSTLERDEMIRLCAPTHQARVIFQCASAPWPAPPKPVQSGALGRSSSPTRWTSRRAPASTTRPNGGHESARGGAAS